MCRDCRRNPQQSHVMHDCVCSSFFRLSSVAWPYRPLNILKSSTKRSRVLIIVAPFNTQFIPASKKGLQRSCIESMCIPTPLPSLRQRRMTSVTESIKWGLSYSSGISMETEMSCGPRNTASTPSTETSVSKLSMASGSHPDDQITIFIESFQKPLGFILRLAHSIHQVSTKLPFYC